MHLASRAVIVGESVSSGLFFADLISKLISALTEQAMAPVLDAAIVKQRARPANGGSRFHFIPRAHSACLHEARPPWRRLRSNGVAFVQGTLDLERYVGRPRFDDSRLTTSADYR